MKTVVDSKQLHIKLFLEYTKLTPFFQIGNVQSKTSSLEEEGGRGREKGEG